MARTIAIGLQDFEKIRTNDTFYIDKTDFIREWWETNDEVTLITRPRRFGKTLTMSMVEQFFSVKYANHDTLFEGLKIWENEDYRRLQGTFPVISLTFANVKGCTFQMTKQRIGQIITDLYNKHEFLLSERFLTDEEKKFFRSVTMDMDETVATIAIHKMSDLLSRYYEKKVIILLDEYDTPMQEAYANGYLEELAPFMHNMFIATFKTNPYLERALLTGITHVSKESIFSDLNNLKVVTTTSSRYTSAFGFTEKEVFSALEEYELTDKREGFVFGEKVDIYNPWSIINYLDEGKPEPYWTNTSGNRLVGKLIQEGSRQIKESFEELLTGGTILTEISEQIVYNQLDLDESAIWSLLLASGYLRVKDCKIIGQEHGSWKQLYELQITNFEVKIMFRKMVQS